MSVVKSPIVEATLIKFSWEVLVARGFISLISDLRIEFDRSMHVFASDEIREANLFMNEWAF